MLALDFDGVVTDNAVYVDSDGKEMVRCSKYDSTGLTLLRKLTDIYVVIISLDKGAVVAARAKKMGIDVIQDVEHKLPLLERIATERGISLRDVCYIGNDVNDLDCLQSVGLGVAVGDSHPAIHGAVQFVTRAAGGRGAIREVCDMILEARTGEE